MTSTIEALVTGFADLAEGVTAEITRLTIEGDQLRTQITDARALIEALLDRLAGRAVAAPIAVQPPVAAGAEPPLPIVAVQAVRPTPSQKRKDWRARRLHGVLTTCPGCQQPFTTEPGHVTVCASCYRERAAANVAKAHPRRWPSEEEKTHDAELPDADEP